MIKVMCVAENLKINYVFVYCTLNCFTVACSFLAYSCQLLNTAVYLRQFVNVTDVEMASGSFDTQRSLQPLTCELKLISQLSAESHLHLTTILCEIPPCHLASILHTYLLRDANGRLSAFQRYAKIFADSCVCAAFDKCVKDNRYTHIWAFHVFQFSRNIQNLFQAMPALGTG